MAVLCLVVSTKEVVMKVRLLNDGGYGDMDDVSLTVVVEVCGFESGVCDLYLVKGSKLIAVGASIDCDDHFDPEHDYAFASKGKFVECEVIE